jgi:hypothetical protein
MKKRQAGYGERRREVAHMLQGHTELFIRKQTSSSYFILEKSLASGSNNSIE